MTAFRHICSSVVIAFFTLGLLCTPYIMCEIAAHAERNGSASVTETDATGRTDGNAIKNVFCSIINAVKRSTHRDTLFRLQDFTVHTAADSGDGKDTTPVISAKTTSGSGGEAQIGITEEMLNAVIVIKGREGSGTGFLARDASNVYIYSNIHVIMGNSGLTFTDRQGMKYKPLGMEFAPDRDLLRLPVDVDNTPLKIITPRGVNVPVSVCGNAEGEGIVRAINGKMIGVGPKKIETDALFVKGNSGSPILTEDGGVVGIATYVRRTNVDWVNTNTPFTVVRRFGYRVDNVPRWLKLSPKTFVKESDKVRQRAERLMNIAEVVSVWAVDPYWQELPQPEKITRDVRAWVDDHNRWVRNNKGRLRTAKGTASNAASISREFHTKLRKDAEQLKNELKRSLKYGQQRWHLGFFEEQWNDLDSLEKTLIKAIDYILTEHTSYNPVQLRR
jgi:S1-C subfamily serine protease